MKIAHLEGVGVVQDPPRMEKPKQRRRVDWMQSRRGFQYERAVLQVVDLREVAEAALPVKRLSLRCYWPPKKVAEHAVEQPDRGSFQGSELV